MMYSKMIFWRSFVAAIRDRGHGWKRRKKRKRARDVVAANGGAEAREEEIMRLNLIILNSTGLSHRFDADLSLEDFKTPVLLEEARMSVSGVFGEWAEMCLMS